MSVCAIFVSFHPDRDVCNTLTAVRPQVQHLVVVDNGSSSEELSSLRATNLGFDLIENGENLGIATALNIGVRRAHALGTEFVLLLDQDSCLTENFVATMLQGFAASPSQDRLGILVPRYVDRRFGHILAPYVAAGSLLEAATTSGSLIPLSLFDRAGYIAEELFIDGVDYEFSLRIRSLGYTIEECPGAILLHSPGTPTYHRLLGSKPFQVGNYSPIRRYYQERNKIWITRRYWRRFYPFLLSQFAISLKDLIKIVAAEDGKRKKLTFFFRGILDGLRGRMGKCDLS